MKNLYIDFDGVMLDTIKTSVIQMNKEGIDTTDFESVTSFYKSVNWENIIKESNFINDSINCVKKIEESNRFRITFLTHVNTINEIVIKKNFIRSHFSDISIIGVPYVVPKTEMVNPVGSILIDDYTVNVETWIQAGGIGIKFSEKNIARDYPVINKLDATLDMEW